MPQYDPFFLQLLWNLIKYESTLSNLALWIEDIIIYILVFFTLYHSYKTYGKFRTVLFFIGCFLFAGLEENFWIIAGSLFPPPLNTYFFTYNGGAIFWFIAIPLHACFAWFLLAYSSFNIIIKILPELDAWKQAVFSAALAMDLDLMLDPIAVRKVSWQWLTGMPGDIFHFPQPCIFGIPFSNFLGWFLLIFVFNWFWATHTTEEQMNSWGGKKKGILYYCLGLLGLEIFLLFILLITTSIIISIFPLGFDVTIGGI
ncbi:MAG: carotenoid biosynthesis protein [Candidatus Helarchaeota archaeon]